MTTFLTTGLLLLSRSCQSIDGNGAVTTTTPEVANFDKMDVSGGSLKIILQQGTGCSVTANGEANILKALTIKTEGNKLKIGFSDGVPIPP
ncbi:MAG: hypothetical protein QM642_08200 [Edaphocola sp.]